MLEILKSGGNQSVRKSSMRRAGGNAPKADRFQPVEVATSGKVVRITP